MHRILVIGASGSGKTSLALELAKRLSLPHTELDSLFHQPNWKETPDNEFREAVQVLAASEQWVIDGNYTNKVADILWPRTTLILWLDYPRSFVMRRLLLRTFKRLFTRETLWNGNRESIRGLFNKDNVIAWSWRSHPVHRKRFPRLLESFGVANYFRFKSPSELSDWLLANW